ncbi:uncharacterized protein [Littorina saxatilis]|uniref:uncharacterized protein n=1 Tax=Littorina saxatilis TaxID=31220 RepID=UPI0038B48E99
MERNKKNRKRPMTEEEKARTNELARLRMQKSRALKKARMEAEAVVSSPAEPRTRRTRATERQSAEAVNAQREQWRKYKQAERKRWNPQKWRRNREGNRKRYHAKKTQNKKPCSVGVDASSSCEDSDSDSDSTDKTDCGSHDKTSDSTTSKQAMKKAKYRIKKALGSVGKKYLKYIHFEVPGSGTSKVSSGTPQSKNVKENVFKELDNLKGNRDRKSLSKRRLLLEMKGDQIQPPKNSPYKRKQKYLSTSAAVEFLQEQAVFEPNKRSVSKGQPRKLLPKRLKRLHKEYVATSNSKVSLRTMYRHLPRHIKTYKHHTLRMALCDVCINVDLKLDVVNQHQTVPVDGRDELSEMSVCQEPTLSCLDRACQECGVNLVSEKLLASLKSDLNTPVKWYVWQMVKKQKGQRKEKVLQEGKLESLHSELMKELTPLSKHIFVQRWQHKELKVLQSKLNVLPGTAVVINDFSENYLCKYQDEVQSAHWGYNQITVHPSVLYFPCHCGNLVTEYLVFVSDDLQHDAHMVRDITNVIRDHLRQKGFCKVVMWSDGCSAQYKSKLPFFFAAESHLQWAFFGSRHGKGPSDACGGVVKVACDEDVRNGALIQNAAQMHEHLSQHHCLPEEAPLPSACCHTLRSFRLIKDVKRTMPSSALKTVQGTRQFHHIRGCGNRLLKTRNLTCFCDPCLQLTTGECESSHVVQDWVDREVVVVKGNEYAPAEPSSSSDPGFLPSADLAPESLSQIKEAVFEKLARDLAGASSYQDVGRIVASNAPKLMDFPVAAQPDLYMTSLRHETVDKIALDLLPSHAPDRHVPVTVFGDGNCLPRSLSLLAYGHSENFVEMRVRLVFELSQNVALYSSFSYLEGPSLNGREVLFHLMEDVENLSSNCTPLEVLQQEILNVCQPGETFNMWGIYAAANILNRPICSVYPDKGEVIKRKLATKKILPTGSDANTPPCYIMWTSNRTDMTDDWWVANHFVPLLPLHPTVEPSIETSSSLAPPSSAAPVDLFSPAEDEPMEEETSPSQLPCTNLPPRVDDLEVNTAVVVQYPDRCYPGIVLEKVGDDYRVEFLKPNSSSANVFVYPAVKDIQIISKDMIKSSTIDFIPCGRSLRQWRVQGFNFNSA